MPVQPIPCAPGGGGDPGDNPGCCSPSIATTPLCREDGTSVLLVVRSGCEECGGPAADPTTVGWIDPATGTFTAGPAPDAVPCDALTCVDTVCRQLCDDADGDGEADTTYTELWCVRADGSAELVLTYRGDPSQPYTPLAPVECAYGCPEDETLTLCDDSGPFLRRYTWLGGSATYADYALDGVTAHVVTGTVTVCSPSDCEAPTTPAATLGLCLADGTPIAVLVTRDCGGQVTQDGWLNLTTGAWSAGGPPAGTMACGNPRNITTAGTFCDVDPDTGDVLGLVLVEYTYAPDGAVDAVRLVDATTGQTYTPQGEVTACPTGVEQPERDVLQLCDTAPDGTVTPFVRDYARDEAGGITGHTDYLLDGTAYVPVGDVGRCVDQCHDCETLALCDTVDSPPATIAGTASSGALPNGVTYEVTAPSPFPPGRQSDGAAWWGTALFPNPVVPLTRWTFNQPVNVEFSVALVFSPATTLPTENMVQLPAGAVPLSLPPGYTYNQSTGVLTGGPTLTGCTLNTPTRAASARFRVAGVSTFTLQYLGSRALNQACQRFGNWEFGALDVSLGGQFARTVCRDCTGAVTSTTDTLLDGVTPYAPVGAVGVCQPEETAAETCRDSSSTLLCDTAAQEAITVLDPANRPGSDGWEIVSYTGYGTGYGPPAAVPYPAPHPAGNAAYMGVRDDLNIGPGPGYTGFESAPVRWIMRKTFTAPEDGTAVVSSTGFRGDGGARVRVNGTDAGMYGQWNQPATSGTAHLPVTAGPNVVEVEVRDGGGQNWLTGRLDIVMTRTVQFMRRTVVDCETGETVTVVDTTLDGEPYEVTGEVGQCQTVTECCEQPPPEARVDVESDVMCIRDAAGEITRQVVVERFYDDQSGERAEQRLTDPTTGDVVPLPAGSELVVCAEPACPVAFSTECVGVVERTEASYDNTSMIGGVPGQCGGVQGPGGQFPCQPTTGGLKIISWTVNGEEVIGDGGRTFAGGPCGEGTAAAPGMHRNWSAALTNLDPTGAVWSAQTEPACAWFVGSTGGTQTTYGPMVVEDATGQQWTLTPAQSCEETQFTKVYTQECDGSVSVSWLDADGVATDPPTGDRVPCGTGCGSGGGRGLDVESLLLCDVAENGTRTEFLRHLSYGSAGQVTGAIDTALDAFTPYTPTGVVTSCTPEPDARVDVETELLCVRDAASGDILDQVVSERVYDQGGALAEQRLTDLSGDPYTLPAGGELTKCPSPDRITRQVCVVESGTAEFLTNAANASSGQDTDWVWAPTIEGAWYPMYRVAPNAVWTVQDAAPAPNRAHWVAPHQSRSVCSPNPANSPNVTAAWFTRASWNLPSDADPDSIRISATIMNGDNGAVQWRLNDGPWQPIAAGALGGNPWTFPPTAVPGGRAGQNEIIIQQVETQPAVTCPSANEGGMIMHVYASYDHAPRVWTQVIEPGGQTYYLDENGDRQDSIPDGQRLVACGGGGDAPCCPAVNTEPVTLCDTAEDGTSTTFLRHYTYTEGAEAPAVRDTLLDGSPYTPTGAVGVCQGEESCPSLNVLSACRWDDTDGDGNADTEYVELLAVDCEGALTSVGTYTPDLAAPYVPVSPAPEPEEPGVPPAVGVQARRLELAAGDTWDADTYSTLRSVTATAHTGTGLITTADGPSTLYRGESVTWGIDSDLDARLTGPLTIAAVDGIVTVAYTTGVNL